MYKPAPPRPKLTNITRTRSGCKECRKRRVKCDEKKPLCGACIRRGRTCEAVQPSLKFHNAFQTSPIKKATPTPPKPKKADHLDVSAADGSYPNHLTLPNSGIVRSLNRSENELYYLTHWDGSCLEALDCCFQNITYANNDNRLLKHSILALSACNLSRSRPECERDNTSGSCHALTYRPHRQHQATSQYYYTSALGQVAKTINETSPRQAFQDTLLAVLVVFCYIESTMGTFPGFNCHAQGIVKFLQAAQVNNKYATSAATDIGRRLLSAYLHSRYQSWWRRLHFSSFEYQHQQPSMALSDEVMSVLWSVNAKRTLVTAILCESYRLNVIGSLKRWEDQKGDVSEYIAMLDNQSIKLDEWVSRLLPSELPREPSNNSENLFPTVKPLLFTSHNNAMNYAYYVVARIMQCTDNLLHSQTPAQSIKTHQKTTTYWLTTLLRIIAGLHKPTCAQLNVYSIGISSLLMACLPRCPDLAIGSWIEAWLLDLLASSVLEEGSFPVAQALAVAGLVNSENNAGNEVCAIGLVEDDGGGGGKYNSYSSQFIDTVVVKGWQRDRPGNRWSKESSLWSVNI